MNMEPNAPETEMGLQLLQKVDWKQDLDHGPQAAINHNLKLFQEGIAHYTKGETHGYYPTENTKYAGIIVPDGTPYHYQPPEDGKPQSVAIVLGEEIVITPPGNPDKAFIFGLRLASARGTEIAVTRHGDDDDFQKIVVTDKEAHIAGQELRQEARVTEDHSKKMEISNKAEQLITGSLEKRTYAYIRLSPKLLDEHKENFKMEGLDLWATDIKGNLLIIQTNSAFDIHVMPHATPK